MIQRRLAFIVAGLLAGLAVPTAPAQILLDTLPRVEAQLLPESSAIVQGESTTIGLRLQIQPGWHTYWKNPGESALATTIDWTLPEGVEAGPIQWPAPEFFSFSGLGGYGYSDEVLLPIRVTVSDAAVQPDTTDPANLTLRARVDWLVCRDICEPGGADLTLTLPVTTEPSRVQPVADHAELFAAAKNRLPRPLPDPEAASAIRGDGIIELRLTPPALTELDETQGGVRFFPDRPMVIDMSADQRVTPADAGGPWRLTMPASPRGEPPTHLRGVLVFGPATLGNALLIDLPIHEYPDPDRP